MYSITDAGEAYLDFWADALEQYRRNVDVFFGCTPAVRRGKTKRTATTSGGLEARLRPMVGAYGAGSSR